MKQILSLAFALSLLCASALTTDAQTRRRTTTKRRPVMTKAAEASAPTAPRIAVGTEMKIRLKDAIDTKTAADGSTFSATVIDPSAHADATIEGHIAKVQQSGKFKGRTSLVLSFDTIRYANGASAPMAAQVVKVYGEDSAKKVDDEGNVQSGNRTETTVKRTGGGAGAGAIIGGIAGGGKGAAIGAIIGAGIGAGSTYIQGSSKVKLDAGTEILIKTTR
jgi:hypothetical protein